MYVAISVSGFAFAVKIAFLVTHHAGLTEGHCWMIRIVNHTKNNTNNPKSTLPLNAEVFVNAELFYTA